eukprot:480431-Hanusia_phi.AAC.2
MSSTCKMCVLLGRELWNELAMSRRQVAAVNLPLRWSPPLDQSPALTVSLARLDSINPDVLAGTAVVDQVDPPEPLGADDGEVQVPGLRGRGLEVVLRVPLLAEVLEVLAVRPQELSVEQDLRVLVLDQLPHPPGEELAGFSGREEHLTARAHYRARLTENYRRCPHPSLPAHKQSHA